MTWRSTHSPVNSGSRGGRRHSRAPGRPGGEAGSGRSPAPSSSLALWMHPAPAALKSRAALITYLITLCKVSTWTPAWQHPYSGRVKHSQEIEDLQACNIFIESMRYIIFSTTNCQYMLSLLNHVLTLPEFVWYRILKSNLRWNTYVDQKEWKWGCSAENLL